MLFGGVFLMKFLSNYQMKFQIQKKIALYFGDIYRQFPGGIYFLFWP